MMNDLEKLLSKILPGTTKRGEVSERITEELENAVHQTSVRHVVKQLAKICIQQDQEQPYFTFDKDAQLLDTISSQIEN